MNVKLSIFLLLPVVLSRDLNEAQRAARAKFIQKIVNTRKHLEGKIKLIGGANESEGNFMLFPSDVNSLSYELLALLKLSIIQEKKFCHIGIIV